MNGIKVVFGVTGNMFIMIRICFICLLFSSCINVGGVTQCDREKKMYKERWDYIVKKTYRDIDYNATYVIETTVGKKLVFQPTEYVVSASEPGYKLLKEPFSEIVYIITLEGDTLNSKIFSNTCDQFILKKDGS